jgi:hypothetical protein
MDVLAHDLDRFHELSSPTAVVIHLEIVDVQHLAGPRQARLPADFRPINISKSTDAERSTKQPIAQPIDLLAQSDTFNLPMAQSMGPLSQLI